MRRPSPTPEVRERVRELRYVDGLSCPEVARRLGIQPWTVKRIAPGFVGKVPNDRVCALFLASGLSAYEVARSLGWASTSGWDSSRVKRTLGLLPEVNGEGRRTVRALIDAETAGLIAEALGHGAWEAEG